MDFALEPPRDSLSSCSTGSLNLHQIGPECCPRQTFLLTHPSVHLTVLQRNSDLDPWDPNPFLPLELPVLVDYQALTQFRYMRIAANRSRAPGEKISGYLQNLVPVEKGMGGV